jgi:AcrR family transcriptional regulator
MISTMRVIAHIANSRSTRSGVGAQLATMSREPVARRRVVATGLAVVLAFAMRASTRTIRAYDSQVPQVRTTPRKQPRQGRSKTTVDTILEATAKVLVRRGFDHLSTNAVADAAGVSIGSVYQYFPNKEARVAALLERHLDDRNAEVFAELARVATLPIGEAVRAVIELAIRAHSVDPELHRVLIEQVPRVGRLARLRELEASTHAVVSSLLVARRHELDIRDVEITAFVLVSAIEAIVHRAVVFHPEHLGDPRLVDEATRLVTRYLGVES